MFFSLSPSAALLSDSNPRLIESYIVLRDRWFDLRTLLEVHHVKHSKDYYYTQRSLKYSTAEERAAQFIYLNRACWNGLYRVNKKGIFNVPIGSKNWILSSDDDFESLSAALSNSELVCSDFREALDAARGGDFVFCDPPYTVAHNFNGFVKYNDAIFSWHDQTDLLTKMIEADRRDVSFFITNADHESVRTLYEPHWPCIAIERHTIISGAAKGRSRTTELTVRNYGNSH